MLPFALAVWLTVKRKCWMSFLAHHNTFIAGAAGSGKSFLIKQISECTTKKIYVTNTTGLAAKVLKKIKPKQSIHLRKLVTATKLKRYVVYFMFCVAVFCFFFCFKKMCLNKLVRAFWLPVSSSHLISVPPTGRDMRRKKWEVSSLVTLLFSVNDRILREICESQTSVISVPDHALADRTIYRARVLKTHKGRHKTHAIKVIWSFIHILKRMWGLPVPKFYVDDHVLLVASAVAVRVCKRYQMILRAVYSWARHFTLICNILCSKSCHTISGVFLMWPGKN